MTIADAIHIVFFPLRIGQSRNKKLYNYEFTKNASNIVFDIALIYEITVLELSAV